MTDVCKPGIVECTDHIAADLRTMISQIRVGVTQAVNALCAKRNSCLHFHNLLLVQ